MDNLIFRNFVYKHIKRVIGFIDTDPESVTFGCADRYYWHYKLHDYINIRFQEAVYILAQAYYDRDSIFYNNQKIEQVIEAVIKFWFKSLNRNGSADEVFPKEQSFCATSFSTYIITETINLLPGKNLVEEDKLNKTGRWLSANGNWHISNQIAASSIALYNIGILLSDKKFIDESRRRLGILLDGLKQYGYFREYEGFDLGYNTLTMSLMARLYQKCKDDSILEALKKVDANFTALFNEYAMYDNKKMSRQTQFVYPFGFKMINSSVLDKIKNGLREDRVLNIDWLDDRYLIGLSNDYLMAYYL